MTQTALYRHFDAEGRLLYIGISLSLMARLASHRHESSWFGEIRRIDVEWFPSYQLAHRAERKAIQTENPKHNKERYDEPALLKPYVAPSVPEGSPGTYPLSERATDRLVDVACRPKHPFSTIAGIAKNFGLDPAYLSQFVVFPTNKGAKPRFDDMIGIVDRLARGTLVSEAPWIIGTEAREDDMPIPTPSASREVTAP